MEYVIGYNLRSVISDKYGIMEITAKKIIRRLLRFINYIDLIGINHCNLKLENIMINIEGAIKVLDFSNAF